MFLEIPNRTKMLFQLKNKTQPTLVRLSLIVIVFWWMTVALCLTTLTFCGYPGQNKPSEITKEIEGEYMFKYPTGQVEIISMHEDSIYDKKIYSNENDYLNKGKPIYENNGSWSISGKELEFDNWLNYCYLRNPDSILVEPGYVDMLDVTWHKSTNNRDAFINVYDENGYVFKKVKEK